MNIEDKQKDLPITTEETTKEVPANTVESLLMEQIKELKEQMKSRDEQIEALTKSITKMNTVKESEIALEPNISSIYKDIEIVCKQEYSLEDAELEFARRINLLREHKGTPSERFIWGNKPSDMWAAEYLHSRGHIKTLQDFYRLRNEAIARDENDPFGI